eukprot:scaffold1762_cov383-Prasinococcus_capsulatus_cf.AAC.2
MPISRIESASAVPLLSHALVHHAREVSLISAPQARRAHAHSSPHHHRAHTPVRQAPQAEHRRGQPFSVLHLGNRIAAVTLARVKRGSDWPCVPLDDSPTPQSVGTAVRISAAFAARAVAWVHYYELAAIAACTALHYDCAAPGCADADAVLPALSALSACARRARRGQHGATH